MCSYVKILKISVQQYFLHSIYSYNIMTLLFIVEEHAFEWTLNTRFRSVLLILARTYSYSVIY